MRKTDFKLKYVVAVVLCICLIAGSVTAGSYSAFAKSQRKIPIYSVDRDDNEIAITFDCAWGTDYTDLILKACDDYGVKVTFFTVQFWTEKYPDYVKKISDKGHEIGTHSKTHGYMSKQSVSEIESELKSSCQAITDVTGKPVELFRAPYGDYDNEVINVAESLGLYTIQWDVDSLDWKDLSAKDIAFRIINKVQSGSIILCHNNGLHTAESLPIVFEFLQTKGYKFVTVSQLIYKENYTVDQTGKQKKNK